MSTDTSIHIDSSNIYYRRCRPADIPTCLQIETASYPHDEAASETSLRYRQENAPPYFTCAAISKIASSTVESNSNHTDDTVIGFICSTRCHTFTHNSMSVHVPDGSILAIHSVVVAEAYRRRGIATQMLQSYIHDIALQQKSSATYGVTRISKIALLAKARLLSFYVNCGFQVMYVHIHCSFATFWKYIFSY